MCISIIRVSISSLTGIHRNTCIPMCTRIERYVYSAYTERYTACSERWCADIRIHRESSVSAWYTYNLIVTQVHLTIQWDDETIAVEAGIVEAVVVHVAVLETGADPIAQIDVRGARDAVAVAVGQMIGEGDVIGIVKYISVNMLIFVCKGQDQLIVSIVTERTPRTCPQPCTLSK